MKKNPPYGDSWIEFHDKLLKEHPEFINTKTITYSFAEIDHDTLKVNILKRKIRMDTLRRNCWNEFQELRQNYKESCATLNLLDIGYRQIFGTFTPIKLKSLLITISNKQKKND